MCKRYQFSLLALSLLALFLVVGISSVPAQENQAQQSTQSVNFSATTPTPQFLQTSENLVTSSTLLVTRLLDRKLMVTNLNQKLTISQKQSAIAQASADKLQKDLTETSKSLSETKQAQSKSETDYLNYREETEKQIIDIQKERDGYKTKLDDAKTIERIEAVIIIGLAGYAGGHIAKWW